MSGIARRHKRENLAGYAFIAPLLVVFVVFVAIPILSSFFLSFTSFNFYNSPRWIGLANFKSIVESPSTMRVMWNTIRFPLLIMPAHVVIGLILAYGITKIRSPIVKWIPRTAIYLPTVLTTASVAIAWGFLYNKEFGAINYFLSKLGISEAGIGWTSTREWAMTAIVIFSVWKFIGDALLYFLLGYSNIPKGYYEAAKIDGASEFQVFFKITLPLLTPTIFYVVLIKTIGAMQAFDEPYFITNGGGPGNETMTAPLLIYQQGFNSFAMGYASAVSVLLFILVFTVSVFQFRMQRKWVSYDY